MNTNKIYAEHIANEYSVKKESKVLALRRLDRKAKLPANIFAYTNGIITSLILGLGMCLSMGVLGNGKYFILGIIIGIIGLVGVSLNYFMYKRIFLIGFCNNDFFISQAPFTYTNYIIPQFTKFVNSFL